MVCVNVMVVAIWLINAFRGEKEESEELRGVDFEGFEKRYERRENTTQLSCWRRSNVKVAILQLIRLTTYLGG